MTVLNKHWANWQIAGKLNAVLTNDGLGGIFIDDPRHYEATGDGTTDDSADYAEAEAAVDLIYLDHNVDYNLGSTKPVKLAWGPGEITLTGSSSSPTVGGFYVGFDVAGGSIISAPEVWAEQANGLTSSPGGIGSYFNVILAPGSNANDTANNNVWRSVIIGEAAGQEIIEWERCEAIGSGAMRFAPYAQRCTAIGTLALQWLGATSQQYLIDTFHDFYIQTDLPGAAGWDFAGLETNNPGIGAAIDAYSTFAASTSNVTQNVAIGRDALLHKIYGSSDTAVGYQSLAHSYATSQNAAFGAFSLRDGVFITNSVGLGYGAGVDVQQGVGNIYIGHEAGENHVKGDRNLIIGGSSGQDHHHDSGHEFSNKLVVEMNSLGTYLTGDMDIGSMFLALEEDDLSLIEALPSGYYNVVSISTTPATPGRFLGTATDTVSTFNSYAGSALARTHATFENTNGVVGTITTTGSATAYNTSSDARDKVAVGTPDSLATINALQVHLARFKTDDEGSERAMLFAQEAETVTPYAVTPPVTDEGRYQMDYSKLVPDLIRAVQVLSARVAELEAQ